MTTPRRNRPAPTSAARAQGKKGGGGAILLVGLLGLGAAGAAWAISQKGVAEAGELPPGVPVGSTLNPDGSYTAPNGDRWVLDAATGVWVNTTLAPPPPALPPPGVPVGSTQNPDGTWTDPNGNTWTQNPDGTWSLPIFYPPAGFQRMKFTFSHTKVRYDEPGRVDVTIAGEYQGPPVWIQARLGANHPAFGGLEAVSIETKLAGQLNWTPFTLKSGGLSWEAGLFEAGTIFSLQARLVTTDGRTNILQTVARGDQTLQIYALCPQFKSVQLEVIDAAGRRVWDPKNPDVWVREAGESIAWIWTVQNLHNVPGTVHVDAACWGYGIHFPAGPDSTLPGGQTGIAQMVMPVDRYCLLASSSGSTVWLEEVVGVCPQTNVSAQYPNGFIAAIGFKPRIITVVADELARPRGVMRVA